MCSWIGKEEILATAPEELRENAIFNYEDRHGISLENYIGYDTSKGGKWTENWESLNNSERFELLVERMKLLARHCDNVGKNEENHSRFSV